MYTAIHAAYREIRETYFPRWDRSGAWQLRICETLHCFGCCDFEKKTIAVRPLPAGDGLRLLLIHELCHCCAGKSHGRKWQAVYTAIRDCASDFPTAPFEEIKTTVCRRMGLCVEEFEETYRRARQVFEELS